MTFKRFLKKLAPYNRKALVGIGTKLLWSKYNIELIYDRETTLINSYAPSIIILALVTCPTSGGENITESEFIELCNSYLKIEDLLQYPYRIMEYSSEIKVALDSLELDSTYLTDKNIKEICQYTCLVRSSIIPQHLPLKAWNTLITMYSVFEILDNNTNGEARKLCNASLEMSPEAFIISGMLLLDPAKKNNGEVILNNISRDKAFEEKYNVSPQSLIKTALKLSLNDQGEEFYKKLTKIPSELQKNFRNILIDFPIINLDNTKNTHFLVPSPIFFVTHFFYKIIYSCFINNKMSAKTGDAFEKYVGIALKEIYHRYNPIKIERVNTEERADYLIELNSCDLIIETKLSLTDPKEEIIMGLENLKKTFKALNKASSQCSNTIKIYKSNNKPKVVIILVAEYLSGQQLPFLRWAKRGLFKKLGISHIGILSWNIFEYIGQRASIEDMTNAMLSQWDLERNSDERELITLTYNNEPKVFKYMKDIEDRLLKKNKQNN